MNYRIEETLYRNPLNRPEDVESWIREGQPIISFPQGCMRLENGIASAEGQASNYLLWCPEVFPKDIEVSWKFKPLMEPGLAMFWCRANGREGKDLFDPTLAKREGQYRQYFDGDIDALHASYFRRKQDDERRFHTCNLRKSKGFHLVCQGGDPIPSVDDVDGWYTIKVAVLGSTLRFSIDDLTIYEWSDDGKSTGPAIDQEGYIGFRQMAPLIAEYSDLEVKRISSH